MEQRLQKLFDFLDQDHDGLIAVEEIGTVARCLGRNVSEAEVQELMAAARTANGMVGLAEVARIIDEHVRASKSTPTAAIVDAFRVFDKEQNGLISVADFKSMMMYMGETLPEAEVDRMLALCPARADGMVDYEAFVRSVSDAGNNAPLVEI